MTQRRRYRWAHVAAMARRTPGVWRLHRDLICVDRHLMRHARRRVPDLQPDGGGVFEFMRANVGRDDTGRLVFDLRVRYLPHNEGTP